MPYIYDTKTKKIIFKEDNLQSNTQNKVKDSYSNQGEYLNNLIKQKNLNVQTSTIPKPTITQKTVGLIPKPVLKVLSSDNIIKFSPLGNVLGKVVPQNLGKETSRFSRRFLDSATFGITGEADSSLGNNVSYREGRKFSEDKLGASLDLAATIAGYAVPGLGWLKGIKALGLGAKAIPKLLQGSTKLQQTSRIAKIAKEQAKEGMAIGAAISGSEIGVREAINPDNYSTKDNLKKLAFDVGTGLVADPLVFGLGNVLGKVISKVKKTPEAQSAVDEIGALKNIDEVKSTIQDVKAGVPIVENTFKVRTISAKRIPSKVSELNLKQEQDAFKKNLLSDEQVKQIELKKVETNTYKENTINDTVLDNQQKNKRLKEIEITSSSDIRKITQGDYLIKVPGGLTEKELSKKVSSFLAPKPNDKVIFEGKPANVKSVGFGKVNLEFKDKTTLSVPYKTVSKEVKFNSIVEKQNNKLQSVLSKIKQTEPIARTKRIITSKNLQLKKLNIERFSKKIKEPKTRTQRDINKDFFKKVDENLDTPSANELVNRPIRTPKNKMESNLIDGVKAKSSTFLSDYVDILDPLKTLPSDIHLYKADTVRANNLVNDSIEKQQLDIDGNVIGRGLNRIIESSGNPIEFEKYLFYRQAYSRALDGDLVFSKEEIIKFGLTPKKILEIVKEMEKQFPDFIQAGKEYNGYFANIRKMMVDEGNWTAEYIKNLVEKYPDYVPFFRDMGGKTKVAINKGVKVGGSERDIVNIYNSTGELTRLYYNFMMHNRANKALLNVVRENPELYKEQGISIVSSQKLNEENAGNEFLSNLNQFEDSLTTKSLKEGTETTKPNEIFAFENGQKIKIKIEDPELYQAFASIPEQSRGILLKTFEFLTKATKRAATGTFAPIWATKGLVMDISRALLNAENPVAHLGLLIKATMDSFTRNGKGLNNIANNFYNAGLGFSGALRTSPEVRFSSTNLKGTGIKGAVLRKVNVINPFSPTSFFAQIQDFTENLNRIAAFEFKKKQITGGTRELTPKEVAICAKYSREITTDYTVKGRKSRELEKGFPYTTASIAGATQLLKSIQKNKMKSAALIGMGVILPKLQEYAQFKDDKDYINLPTREKYRNIIYGKTADGKFLKLPLDPGLGVIGELVIKSLQAYEQQDKNAFNGAMEEILNSFAPPPVQGVLKAFTSGDGIAGGVRGLGMASSLSPFVATATNKTFTNAPIESLGFQLSPLRPGLRYSEQTSKISRKIGEITNFSPFKVDYLLKAYGGDISRIALPLNSDVGSIKSEDFLKNFITDPTFSNNLANQFYKGRDRLKSARASNLDLGKELPKWYSERIYQGISSQANNSVNKKLSYYTKLKRSTSIDKNLTAPQRKEKMRDIQKSINEIYLDWNTLMKNNGVPLE